MTEVGYVHRRCVVQMSAIGADLSANVKRIVRYICGLTNVHKCVRGKSRLTPMTPASFVGTP